MTRLPRLLIITASLLLGACAALTGKHDTFTVYTPRLDLPKPANASSVTWQLLIETPRASAALDTPRIAAMPTAGVLEFYPAARWRDPAPYLLRSLIVQAFDDSGRITGVSGSTSGLSADYSLAIELRDFQIELSGGSAHAAIRLTAKLFDHRDNRIVAMRTFNEETPAADSGVTSAVGAFEQALNRLLPQIVDWTLQQGEAQRRTADANKPDRARAGSPDSK
jgi:cholesterol transport system auxiliary component